MAGASLTRLRGRIRTSFFAGASSAVVLLTLVAVSLVQADLAITVISGVLAAIATLAACYYYTSEIRTGVQFILQRLLQVPRIARETIPIPRVLFHQG